MKPYAPRLRRARIVCEWVPEPGGTGDNATAAVLSC